MLHVLWDHETTDPLRPSNLIKMHIDLPVCSILLPPLGLNARPWTFVNDVKLKYAKNCDLEVDSSILKWDKNNNIVI